jgi:hypothetical protein
MSATVSSESGYMKGLTQGRKNPASPVRKRFVEQSEGWIKKLSVELPETYVEYAVTGNPSPDDLLKSVAELVSGDQMHRALLLRYVRAVEQLVQKMPNDLILSTISAPSDFGALVRALSDPRVSEPSRRTDPLAGAVGRSINHRDRLRQMAGEMLSSSQVEELLGIRRQAIDKRRKAHKLLALRMGSDWSYPALQFDGGEVLFGLENVLNAHAEKDPWVILDILLAPDEVLSGRTLLQAMQEKDEQAIARHIAQVGGDGFA